MKHNILCLYYDDEIQFLAQDPESEFADHDVTVVHTYEEARNLLFSPTSTFDIVLADAVVPYSNKHLNEMGPSVLLAGYLNSNVRGFGMFVPRHFESEYTSALGPQCVMVADRTCWTITEQRDWRKLLVYTIQRVAEFVI